MYIGFPKGLVLVLPGLTSTNRLSKYRLIPVYILAGHNHNVTTLFFSKTVIIRSRRIKIIDVVVTTPSYVGLRSPG